MKPKFSRTLVWLRPPKRKRVGGWTRLLICVSRIGRIASLPWLQPLYRVHDTVRSTTSALQAAGENERAPKKQTKHVIFVIRHQPSSIQLLSYIIVITVIRHHQSSTSLLSDIIVIIAIIHHFYQTSPKSRGKV